MPSQSAIKYILENHEQFDKEIQANVKTLQERYEVTKKWFMMKNINNIGKHMILTLDTLWHLK